MRHAAQDRNLQRRGDSQLKVIFIFITIGEPTRSPPMQIVFITIVVAGIALSALAFFQEEMDVA